MNRDDYHWTDPMLEEACNYNKNKRKSFEQDRNEKNKEVDLLMENNFDSNLQKEFKSGPKFIDCSEENESEILKNDDIRSSSIEDNFDSGAETDEMAISQLFEICAYKKWNPPLYEKLGPTNQEMFRYKVTIKVDTITTTIVECFGESNYQREEAKEQAAKGALWFLNKLGHCSN
ncbi:hypothetical protein LUZ60_002998 [Juncus effusus]|nr:hypothetical protein LUZ60_002998 [Juncus effusus]